jgi:endo-1,4-beta-xylanase
VKKKAQSLKVSKVVKFSNKGVGTLSYKKKSGNKKIAINKKTGKVTVKKGLKKGTYKVKVAIKAAGNGNYNAKTINVTFKVKVK